MMNLMKAHSLIFVNINKTGHMYSQSFILNLKRKTKFLKIFISARNIYIIIYIKNCTV